MKSILRSYLINVASLFAALFFIKGFTYDHKIETLLFGGACFTIINWFIKPIVKILTLPLNLLTLGVFSWVTNALMIFILTKLVVQFQIKSWYFQGFSFQGFTVPSLTMNILFTYIAVSLIIALVGNFLHWLSK